MTVLDISNVKARRYFLEPQNYGSTELPFYFDFTGILSFVSQNVKGFCGRLAVAGRPPYRREDESGIISR